MANFPGRIMQSAVLSAALMAGSFHADAASITSIAQRDLNDIRRQVGLANVKPDNRLARAAKTMAVKMAETGQMSHSLGGPLRIRVRAAGFPGVAGENLGRGYSSVSKLIIDWMKSPSHRRNILNGRYTCFGIAREKPRSPKAKHSSYWALILGSC